MRSGSLPFNYSRFEDAFLDGALCDWLRGWIRCCWRSLDSSWAIHLNRRGLRKDANCLDFATSPRIFPVRPPRRIIIRFGCMESICEAIEASWEMQPTPVFFPWSRFVSVLPLLHSWNSERSVESTRWLAICRRLLRYIPSRKSAANRLPVVRISRTSLTTSSPSSASLLPAISFSSQSNVSLRFPRPLETLITHAVGFSSSNHGRMNSRARLPAPQPISPESHQAVVNRLFSPTKSTAIRSWAQNLEYAADIIEARESQLKKQRIDGETPTPSQYCSAFIPVLP